MVRLSLFSASAAFAFCACASTSLVSAHSVDMSWAHVLSVSDTVPTLDPSCYIVPSCESNFCGPLNDCHSFMLKPAQCCDERPDDVIAAFPQTPIDKKVIALYQTMAEEVTKQQIAQVEQIKAQYDQHSDSASTPAQEKEPGPEVTPESATTPATPQPASPETVAAATPETTATPPAPEATATPPASAASIDDELFEEFEPVRSSSGSLDRLRALYNSMNDDDSDFDLAEVNTAMMPQPKDPRQSKAGSIGKAAGIKCIHGKFGCCNTKACPKHPRQPCVCPPKKK